MSALFEVHSFVNKFLTLCNNGETANLSLKCQDGKTVIDLQLHLPSVPPPPPYHPQSPPPRAGPSPSRVRRSARRAHYRAANNASKTEEVSADLSRTIFPSDVNINTAEQAANGIASDDIKNSIRSKIEDIATTREADQLSAQQTVYCTPVEQAVTLKTPHQHDQEQTSTSSESFHELARPCELGDTISAHPQLICNYCDKAFESEESLREHTSIEHRSGRIRFRRV